MQLALFILSLGVGPRMIWLINRGSWLVNMRQVCYVPFRQDALFTDYPPSARNSQQYGYTQSYS